VERIARACAVFGIALPKYPQRPVRYIVAICIAVMGTCAPIGAVFAAGALSTASVALSDPQPSDAANYTFTGSSVDAASSIYCVQLIWSTTATGTTAPTGFSGAAGSINAASSTLINSSATNWSLAKSDGTSSSGQNNIYQYTNSSSGVVPTTTTGATFIASGITNSSVVATTYYLQLNTYGNTNCSSSLINSALVDYTQTSGSTLSLSVNPTLSFMINPMSSGVGCDGTTTTAASTSSTIPFGSASAASNDVVCQDLQAATNAANGFSIFLSYTAPPTSGSNTIAPASGSNSSPAAFSAPGTAAYGYSTDDATLGATYGATNRFTSPVQGWAAASTSNGQVGYEPTGVTTTDFHIGHQVGVATITPSGTYSTTIIYTCTPIY
jgi:hypothetical protein